MISRSNYLRVMQEHYRRIWGNFEPFTWLKGPVDQLPAGFVVLRFQPPLHPGLFIYATSGMSEAGDAEPVECFLLSPLRDETLCELLTIMAWYHRKRARLGWGYTIDFGRPWLQGSRCDYGLFTTPHLEKPELEWLKTEAGRIRFLWLVPITAQERSFKMSLGMDALESRFESGNLDYANPYRHSVVENLEMDAA